VPVAGPVLQERFSRSDALLRHMKGCKDKLDEDAQAVQDANVDTSLGRWRDESEGEGRHQEECQKQSIKMESP